MSLYTDIARIAIDRPKLQNIVNGDPTVTVATDGGVVPSLSRLLSQMGAGQIKGAWVTATAYVLGDVVTNGGTAYRCILAHSSAAALATDLTAGKWIVHYTATTLTDTIAALKGLANTYGTVILQGYSAAGDGGGGIYRWNGADSSADNGGTIIQPAALPATGRWNRLLDQGQALNVRGFGAKGDGATNDAAAIQAAATLAGTIGGSVYIPGTASYYALTSDITVPAGVAVQGDGLKSRIKQTAREKNVFILSNDCQLTGLNIEGDGLSSTGIAFTKNNGVLISGVRNCVVDNCAIHGFEFNGIMIQNSFNLRITGNLFYDNKYGNDSAADIIWYSGVEGGRSIIAHNRCFSNNSQGIYVDAQGFDHDLLVSDNICVTLDATTWLEVASGSLARRHGIVIGYNGGTGRYVVSNNICRNTRQTGIYYQSAFAPTCSIQILGNQCSLNGINPIDLALAAGIYVAAQGKGDIISGNSIEDYVYDLFGANGGIAVKPSVPSTVAVNASTLVSGNSIRRSGCHGIILGGYAIRVTVADNLIADSFRSDICWSPIAAVAAIGDFIISGNRTIRNNVTSPSIELDFQSSTMQMHVRNNFLTGNNAATNSAQNSGIKWSGNPEIHVTDNVISSFYHGAYQSTYLAGRAFTAQHIDRNTFKSCTNGVMVAGTTTAPVLVLQDNLFIGCTTKASGAAIGADVCYIGQRFGDKIYQQAAAIPTLGTWVVGDRVQQMTPVVGNPKGWVCTVAGNPGTWVSEGNL